MTTLNDSERIAKLEQRVSLLEQLLNNNSTGTILVSQPPTTNPRITTFCSLTLPQTQPMFEHHYNYFFKTLSIPATSTVVDNNTKNLRMYKHFKACFGEVPSKKYLRKLFGKQYDTEHKFVKLVVKMYNWYNQIKCKRATLSAEFVAACEMDREWKWSQKKEAKKEQKS